jgi:predicted glycosyl hydrolase (DUF1957 family)
VLGNLDLASFDIAPAVLRHMEVQEAAAYSRILAADRGNAIATTYHPITLPSLTRRDKLTEVIWGQRAFLTHFGREAEGLWLHEMAVDDETLDVLAECGLRFTLLSSEQLRGDLAQGGGPYRVRTAGGRHVAVLARNRELSDKISFELNWLGGAGMFAARYLAARPDEGLLLLATDAETYGHYHPGEEMFLRYLLQREALQAGYRVTPLTTFVREHPPQATVNIFSPSSWRTGGEGIHEKQSGAEATWATPLRQALHGLADALDAIYECAARSAGLDAWALRNDFADVLLERTSESDFMSAHETRALAPATEERLLLLLQAQAHRLSMFSSDAFKETEFGSITLRYVIAHAVRAVSLVADATGDDLSGTLRRDLAQATDPRGDRTATEIYTEIVEAQHM